MRRRSDSYLRVHAIFKVRKLIIDNSDSSLIYIYIYAVLSVYLARAVRVYIADKSAVRQAIKLFSSVA